MEITDKNQLFIGIDAAVTELVKLLSPIDKDQINSIPYKDSWTPGQLLRHVTKSTNGMTKAMLMESKPAQRDSGEKIPQLKKAFLNFTNKMKSPDFIIPEDVLYEKQACINELNISFEQFKNSTNNANLNDIVEGLPLGEITKLEIIHFVLYHTQRHLHQMKKICDALK